MTLYKDADWQGVYNLAKAQTVQGIAFDGLINVSSSIPWIASCVDETLTIDWMEQLVKITRRNMLINTAINIVSSRLDNVGVHYIFMKGQVCGARWPIPEHRVSGDCDVILLEEDFKKAEKVFMSMGATKREGAEFKHVEYCLDTISWEIHFSVHRFGQERLQWIIDGWVTDELQANNCKLRIADDITVPAFLPDLEITYLLLHFVNHIIHEGCGMRQLIDFVLVLQRNLPNCAASCLLDKIEALQLTRAFHATLYLCEIVLGVEWPLSVIEVLVPNGYSKLEMYLACKMEQRMMIDGNFGHATGWQKPKGLWGSFCYNWRSFRREIHFIPLWPREMLLFPIEVIRRKA